MAAGSRHPFEYPRRRHRRRHTPAAGRHPSAYKPFLRDEFVFTCVYCLSRETWFRSHASLGVEHFKARSWNPSAAKNYANLLYACNDCNRAKGSQPMPDDLHPEINPWASHLRIENDGSVKSLTKDGEAILDILALNEPDLVRWRRVHLELFTEAFRRRKLPWARQQLRDFFGFPPKPPVFPKGSGGNNPYSARPDKPEWF